MTKLSFLRSGGTVSHTREYRKNHSVCANRPEAVSCANMEPNNIKKRDSKFS
jgi:hypothetical protein